MDQQSPRSKMHNAPVDTLDKRRLYRYSALSHQIQAYFQDDLRDQRERRSTTDKRLSLLLQSRLNARKNSLNSEEKAHEMTNEQLYKSLLHSITEGKNYRPIPQPAQHEIEQLAYLNDKTQKLQDEINKQEVSRVSHKSQLNHSKINNSMVQSQSLTKYMTNQELLESIFTDAYAASAVEFNEHGVEVAVVDRLAKPESAAQQRCYNAIQNLQFGAETDKEIKEKAKKNGQEVYKLLRGQKSMQSYVNNEEADPWVQKMSNIINQVDNNNRVSKSGSRHSESFRQVDEQVALSINGVTGVSQGNDIESSGTLRPADLGLPDESPVKKQSSPHTNIQALGLQVLQQKQQLQELIKNSQTVENQIYNQNYKEQPSKPGDQKVLLINELRNIFVEIDGLLSTAQNKLNQLQLNKLRK